MRVLLIGVAHSHLAIHDPVHHHHALVHTVGGLSVGGLLIVIGGIGVVFVAVVCLFFCLFGSCNACLDIFIHRFLRKLNFILFTALFGCFGVVFIEDLL